MLTDKEKLKLLETHKPPCLDTLKGRATQLNSEKQTVIMEFDAVPEFCHSEAQIVQGGFITGMMDTCMAHLLIALLDFKFNPMSLDINVSFLAPAHPGILVAEAKILRIGKSIAFLSSTLSQGEKLVATSTSTIKLIPRL
ncbi:uncharacterized protein METZ01_LOCUS87942 [marine metagenome]|jgi:uncharacterized protein (TIGR00369 family)|uniref:Thioesterase domain-containing protein n=1 Tax=marine metagenome TaxID=408172 RepID=A0A381V5N4_9ZZZZ